MQGEMFEDKFTIPPEAVKDLPSAVEFLMRFVLRRDIDHLIEIAVRDHKLQTFIGHVCTELDIDADTARRLWNESEVETLANLDEIIKEVRETKEVRAIEEQIKKQFGEDPNKRN